MSPEEKRNVTYLTMSKKQKKLRRKLPTLFWSVRKKRGKSSRFGKGRPPAPAKEQACTGGGGRLDIGKRQKGKKKEREQEPFRSFPEGFATKREWQVHTCLVNRGGGKGFISAPEKERRRLVLPWGELGFGKRVRGQLREKRRSPLSQEREDTPAFSCGKGRGKRSRKSWLMGEGGGSSSSTHLGKRGKGSRASSSGAGSRAGKKVRDRAARLMTVPRKGIALRRSRPKKKGEKNADASCVKLGPPRQKKGTASSKG